MMYRQTILVLFLMPLALPAAAEVASLAYPLPRGEHPHDVAPDPGGGAVWYTAQRAGGLGRLDPATGKTSLIPLGDGSAPHGVIVGPDGAPWITDSGLNAIVRVDPQTLAVKRYPLPDSIGYANLNTAAFDGNGALWFTGQSGIYGSLDPHSGTMKVFDAPRGRGPYMDSKQNKSQMRSTPRAGGAPTALPRPLPGMSTTPPSPAVISAVSTAPAVR